jgi:hypothetical protein
VSVACDYEFSLFFFVKSSLFSKRKYFNRKQKFQKQSSSLTEDGKDADIENDEFDMLPLDDQLEGTK